MHEVYDDLNLEKVLKAQFHVNMEIDSVIARKFPVSRSGYGTLFLNDKRQLFLYIENQGRMTLNEVKKIVSRVGLKAGQFLPPKGQSDYFDEIGRQKFREVFPGRGYVSEMDISYYRTLAPYNPALIAITEVKDGVVRQYDPDARDDWRPIAQLTYRRIRTS